MKNDKKTTRPNQHIEFEPHVSKRADFNDYDEDYEDEGCLDCPKCGRAYDEIDAEYQICSKCGWNAGDKEQGKPRRPTNLDYMNGEADIITGDWY